MRTPMTRARFEIVHTGPHRFHARFVAANGETVWVSESYRRRQSAAEAIDILRAAASLSAGYIHVDER